jgi:hypothetical protein
VQVRGVRREGVRARNVVQHLFDPAEDPGDLIARQAFR